MKIWYLKHPLSLYVESREEIKKLARDNGFRIIDAKFGSNDEATPKLKKRRKKKVVDEFADQN